MIDLANADQIIKYLRLHRNIQTEKEAKEVILILERNRKKWSVLRHPQCQHDFFFLYFTYANACIRLKDYNGAIQILQEGIQILESEDFKYFLEEKQSFYDLLCKCYIQINKESQAYESLLKSVFYELYAINNRHYSNYEFYSFRSVSDYSLADIRNRTISLCNPTLFNDPVDTALFPWIHLRQEVCEDKNEKTYLRLLERVYENIRVRCLVRNVPLPYREGREIPMQKDSQREYANTIMWAHYANFHKGFCIRYVIPSTFTSTNPNDEYLLMLAPVKYVENFPLVDSSDSIRDISFEEAFFTKHKRWEYEHEHRLLYFHKKDSTDYPTPMLPKGAVQVVYIGARCKPDDKKRIVDALSDMPNVELYQMQFNLQDIYKLEAVKIYR